jgi:hypothetical protein
LTGCLYDWNLPDEARGGGGTEPIASGGAGASGGFGSTGGGPSTGGTGGVEEGGGGLGGEGGGGASTTGCRTETSCTACKLCVYDALSTTGTPQDCAMYLGCVVTCGTDVGCQSQCMTTFPDGYAIQLELLQSCSAQCPNNPSCI